MRQVGLPFVCIVIITCYFIQKITMAGTDKAMALSLLVAV